ncbi:PTS mannose/fructose/sorbose/N-acetylgalactosamine transporter subunit IIC [Holdemania massiliensis]|uniref:PTS mannose/fructose/sorbose/N-acetylgalactosamine transporter subunit IIC n=1 Tax=Holdemania massiliensis TaxID=1468449 RepID=UPI001F05249B|nr:PTS sugar transporter subunit IIC [Holdemania massiliensis]MCH1942649.1 PTS sugar transporter subunit IIC [Holdemania massiliensis]
MIQNALIVVLAYFLVEGIDILFGWKTFQRPIVAATVTGIVLGDVRTGVIMGASLEGIFMGISQIGGSVPSDASSASVIAVAMTVLAGTGVETGLALAMPIGTVMSTIKEMYKPVQASLAPYWERLAHSGNISRFRLQVLLCGLIFDRLPQYLILFFSIAFGVESLQTMIAALPIWAMNGLSAASGMMTGIGFAILTSMIWDKEVGGFFFVGFVMAKYLNLGTLPIAIIMTVVAIMHFFNDKKLVDLKKLVSNEPGKEKTGEDFF